MVRSILLLTSIALFLGACIQMTPPPVKISTLAPSARFVEDVQPILDSRCVVCHSCYNSACQLQLGSYEGIIRGGSKSPVYSGSRLVNQPPTRLFIDADSTEGWRSKGFHSVTDSTADEMENDSLMLHVLAAKRAQPVSTASYSPEAENLTCAGDTRELGAFMQRYPERGMPFGFPALSEQEYTTLATWLLRGAAGPTEKEVLAKKSPSDAAAAKIDKWESFLNRDDPKYAMTARYLYEHFFLAHLVFSDVDKTQFFELVRSSTPPGEPISVIATLRPYDDTGVTPFFYRFRKIHSTIVYKTHMVVEFTEETFDRYHELFIDTPWLEKPHWEPLDDKKGANPFLIYAQIPPVVRYKFMLDHSEYFIRSFIRGPVCKGQIALNVINDHFWTMFVDPAADETVQNPDFLIEQAENLRLSNELGSDGRILAAFSNQYRDRYARFYNAKTILYDELHPDGTGIEAIWKGRRPADSPLLTIYRHFDSASVHRGVIGDLPRTMWVIDYPQFERIYYSLVAGFDVFGNVTHQVNVRRYMDYLRIEGELNFLQFMPKKDRLPMMKSWYIGDKAIANVKHEEVASKRETRIQFKTDDPKRELIETVVSDHILKSAKIEFDEVNYHPATTHPQMPTSFETDEDILNGFRALTAPGTAFIRHNNGTGINLLYVRVKNYKGQDHMFSIVINRWHDNVNSLFGEEKRLDPTKDTIDFVPGSIGAYPNYFFDVEGTDVPDFFDLLANFDDSPEYHEKIDKYGVNRGEAHFWEAYDWFQNRLETTDPLHAGLYDLNRYYLESNPD